MPLGVLDHDFLIRTCKHRLPSVINEFLETATLKVDFEFIPTRWDRGTS